MIAIARHGLTHYLGRLLPGTAAANTYFSLVGINFLLAGLSFATTLVIANVLGPGAFGELSYALAVSGYCLTLASCGLEQTLVRDLVQSPGRFGETASAGLVLRACMLVVSVAGLAVFNLLSPPEDRLGPAGLLIVITEGIRALQLAEVYDALRKSRRNALYLLGERVLYFGLVWTVIFAFRDRLSIEAIAIAMFLSMSLGLFLQYRWALPRVDFRLDRSVLALAFRMLRGNLWVWSAVLATLSFGTLSKIVLKRVDGNAELGGYSVAWQVVPLGLILIYQAGRLGNPRLAVLVGDGASAAGQARFLLRYGGLSTLAGCVIGLPAILFPEAILRAFRPEYASCEGALRILGVYVILLGAGHVAMQFLIAARRERAYALIVMVSGLAGVGLYAVLIPRWSSEGAALAVVISHGLAIVLYLAACARHLAAGTREKTATESPANV